MAGHRGRDKEVTLPFGEGRVTVQVPADADVVVPRHVEAVTDPRRALADALTRPIGGPTLDQVVAKGATVAISVCDPTRPQPRREVLTALLEVLDGRVREEDVSFMIATGSHRPTREDELEWMFGSELMGHVRIVDHDARDEVTLRWCGRHGNDVPVWLNRQWCESDVRITTGFVEPHFFAGFSGGPKMVAPGLAGLATILTLHDAERIGHPRATWGVCEGNPVHDDVRAIAAATGVDFCLDVTLDREHRLTGAFAGQLFAAHRLARERVAATSIVPVAAPYDVVLTSTAGYPLDRNVYQAVKGMSAAAGIVRPGGVIVCVAECRDGFPDGSSFHSMLTAASAPQDLVDRIPGPGFTVADQWQAQVLAGVLAKATVMLYAPGIADDALRAAHLLPAEDISAAVTCALARAGDGARLCVLSEGPQTITRVAR